MRWDDFIAQVNTAATNAAAVEVRGVQYDSRRVTAGDVFVAMRGGSVDGNRFIDAAVRQGAVGVLTDSPETYGELRARQPELALGLLGHERNAGRRGLAEASSAVFDRPQEKLKVSAVTGTNGKTTTAYLLEQMLTSVGRKCLLIGTIETRIAGVPRPSEHTTPESRDLLALFAEAVRAECTEVVMEMSSHALEQERVWGIPVDVAIFTNLTQDHLDYHGTMERYAAAKAKLFAGIGTAPPRVAVMNADDAAVAQMIEAARRCDVQTYGIGYEQSTWWTTELTLQAGRTAFCLETPEGNANVESALTGKVNVYNLVAAQVAAWARGVSLDDILDGAPALRQVPGRFEVVAGSSEAGFTVVVDYAHTDDALRNLIELGRGLAGDGGGRVITMFGCGGDRDRTKRAKMGRVAGSMSDFVVMTSDNPRNEEPMAIIDEIALGVRETSATFVVEEDRRAAIELAIRAAKPGDIVLLAGKGHEKTQTFADGAVLFDDVAVAAGVLKSLAAEAKS